MRKLREVGLASVRLNETKEKLLEEQEKQKEILKT